MKNHRHLGWIALAAVALLGITSTAFAQGGSQGKYDPLTLSCVSGGEHFVEVQVKAGASGAPAGFTLQWMTLDAWEANGEQWYSSDDPRLCKMSFSGQPSFSGAHDQLRWELDPYGETVVRIGDLLYDETGVSGALSDDGTGHFTQPDCQLDCGTEYVFRAFAHASRFNGRSLFSFISTSGSPELTEPGAACGTTGTCGGCTFTQGYWKTHGAGDCHSGNNADAWCVSSLELGTVTYNKDQLCAILNAAAKGNGLLVLAHQLIAAKLNAACNGASCASADIATADAFIGAKVIPPVGTASVKASALPSGLVTTLDNFNNGIGCASHCSGPNGANGVMFSKPSTWGKMKIRYR